jgi:two-component system chemotaxis response regulator CheY
MFSPDTRILVADDMPTIRELVKNQLRAMGFKNTLEAADGEQALSVIIKSAEAGQPVQFVISDWNMPNLTGLELLKRVRANPKLAKLPFVLLTSETERDQVTEAILAGVNQYIVKPFTPKSFEDKIKAVWAKLKAAG